MQGKHSEVEPSICAVAHQCWMCPARSAFRVGGPWSKPDKKPRWEEPRDQVAKLPKEILDHALRHTLPTSRDYMRAGIYEGTPYNDHLSNLQAGVASKPPLDELERQKNKSKAPPKSKAKRKPKSNADALDQVDTKSMSKAVTDAVADEKKPKAPPKKPAPKKPAPKTQPKSEGKKLSLAERAKLMKAKRAAAG
jgi:hypothetical protein